MNGGGTRRHAAALGLAAILAAGCGGAPILANEPLAFATPPMPTARPVRPPDPIPIELPRDDGPHDRLTEWWYYTGHLFTEEGRRFGFEAVIFRAERSSVPVAWAAHLALTDEEGQAFHYAQRSEVGPQVDASPVDATGSPSGFDLRVVGLSPTLIAQGAPAVAAAPWRLAGSGGKDRIEAALAPEEAGPAGASFGLALDLDAQKAPALHDEDGFLDFGPAGSSYYYSRTRLGATGELTLDGQTYEVTGQAWFDHQWGDFVSVGGGGWDWFAVQLDDGTDITWSIVLDARGEHIVEYGTVVSASGDVRHVTPPDAFVFERTFARWDSPATGISWPASWEMQIDGMFITLRPTVRQQELDTRATTGVIYWEGSQIVQGTDASGAFFGGEAYIELTRYNR